MIREIVRPEKEQLVILETIRRIKTKEALIAVGTIIDSKPHQDVLYETMFVLDSFLEDFPILTIDMLQKYSYDEPMWRMIKEFIQEAYYKAKNPTDPKAALYEKTMEPPIIGISQEGERRRLMINSFKSNLEINLGKIIEMEKSDNKNQKNDAKKLLKFLEKISK